jgi:predicted enzyme related to lactoylglutathione lyase
MFTRGGVPVAGGMGPMGDGPEPTNSWTPYFATDDIAKTIDVAADLGGVIAVPAMPVDDLGIQAVLDDSTGGRLGFWQPGTFTGFSVLNEPGAPSWFELHVRDYAKAVAFYTDVLGVEVVPVSDTDEFLYSVLRPIGADQEVAGIMQDAGLLAPAETARWIVYWEVDDVAATLRRVDELGGNAHRGPDETPYGVLGSAGDPAGAIFNLRQSIP